MKRFACLVVLVVVGIVGSTLFPSQRTKAITYGFVDSNNTYSNTGAFIVKSPTTGKIFPICSGTMITSNVFLTASHCTVFFDRELAPRGYTAYVSFDKSIPFGDLTSSKTKLIVATSVTN